MYLCDIRRGGSRAGDPNARHSSSARTTVSDVFSLGRGVGSFVSEGRGVSSTSSSSSFGSVAGDDSGGVWNSFFNGDRGPRRGDAPPYFDGVTVCVTGSESDDVTAIPSWLFALIISMPSLELGSRGLLRTGRSRSRSRETPSSSSSSSAESVPSTRRFSKWSRFNFSFSSERRGIGNLGCSICPGADCCETRCTGSL